MRDRFQREDRSNYLTDERMAVFKALTPARRLAWVEQMAAFLRKAAIARTHQDKDQPSPFERADFY